MEQADECFSSLIHAIDRSKDEAQLREALNRIVGVYGLQHYTYLGFRLPGDANPDPTLKSSYPAAWLKRYVEQNYFTIDPVVAAGAAAILPVDWAELDQRSPLSRRVFGEANEFGIGRQGVTVPVRGPLGDQALFTVTVAVSGAEWKQRKPYLMRDCQAVACRIHAAVLRLSGRDDIRAPRLLSPRERECLEHAATGMTNKLIARELGISERVVRAYFETARNKLRCRNRSHVISRAICLGFIQPPG